MQEDNHYENYEFPLGILNQLQVSIKNSHFRYFYFSLSHFLFFSSSLKVFDFDNHFKSCVGNFFDIAQPYKLFASRY